MCSMKKLYFLFTFLLLLFAFPALASDPVFYETLPLWAKMIIAGVAFAIPTKIIFAHIGLFEFLAASIVGLVFGSFMTVIFILAT